MRRRKRKSVIIDILDSEGVSQRLAWGETIWFSLPQDLADRIHADATSKGKPVYQLLFELMREQYPGIITVGGITEKNYMDHEGYFAELVMRPTDTFGPLEEETDDRESAEAVDR